MQFNIGLEKHGQHLPSCIGINPHTLLLILEELCDEIARNGFDKILIANSHGGNVAMLSYFVRAQCYKSIQKPLEKIFSKKLNFFQKTP